MKIDANRQTGDAEALARLEKAGKGDQPKGTRQVGSKTDRVEVSADARLMTDALKAASGAPAVRQDVVERMRKLLEAGELGQDSGRLADSIIDDLLKKP